MSRPRDLKYTELVTLLRGFGYREYQGAGSRIVFINEELKHKIKIHKPHPGNIMKGYQIDLIIKELVSKGII
jgi:hypothetical protein